MAGMRRDLLFGALLLGGMWGCTTDPPADDDDGSVAAETEGPPDGCMPVCDGRVCGPDGCGGICGTCPPELTCNEQVGQCEQDGECVPTVDCAAAMCTDDDGCGMACGCADGLTCNEASGQCIDPSCVPDCAGRECGDDGCEGSCGECVEGSTCVSGACVAAVACTSHTECDPGQACDPATLQCTAACAGVDDCSEGQHCVYQDAAAGVGICVDGCATLDGSVCGQDSTCLPVGYTGEDGVCFPDGTAGEGEACAPSEVDTGCTSGLACVTADGAGGENVCRGVCNYWGGGAAGCEAGQICTFYGVCTEHLLVVDSAAIGEECSTIDAFCGEVDGRATGICDASDTCVELCRLAHDDCNADLACIQHAAFDFDQALSMSAGICSE
jgi:hypothetical protein